MTELTNLLSLALDFKKCSMAYLTIIHNFFFPRMAQIFNVCVCFPLLPIVPWGQLVVRLCANTCLGRHEVLFVQIQIFQCWCRTAFQYMLGSARKHKGTRAIISVSGDLWVHDLGPEFERKTLSPKRNVMCLKSVK